MANEKTKFKIYAREEGGPGDHVFFIESFKTVQSVQEAVRARLGSIQINRMFYKGFQKLFGINSCDL